MHTVLKNLERIEITGFFSESEVAFEFCRIHNYHITRSGPAPTDTPHRYDMNKFLIIAERETPVEQRGGMSEMDDYYDDDEEEFPEDDEPNIEDVCVEFGCFRDGRHGACGCCGAPLCFMHEEILAGFCTVCSEQSDFSERMKAIYGELEEELTSQQTPHIDATATVDDEIPF